MPGRMFTTQNYRYGLNGQEKDDEINGIAGAYTSAEYWEYDSRLGKRWNIDPVVYPWQSSYACFNNNPIYFADPSGLEGEKKGGDPNCGKNPEISSPDPHAGEKILDLSIVVGPTAPADATSVFLFKPLKPLKFEKEPEYRKYIPKPSDDGFSAGLNVGYKDYSAKFDLANPADGDIKFGNKYIELTKDGDNFKSMKLGGVVKINSDKGVELTYKGFTLADNTLDIPLVGKNGETEKSWDIWEESKPMYRTEFVPCTILQFFEGKRPYKDVATGEMSFAYFHKYRQVISVVTMGVFQAQREEIYRDGMKISDLYREGYNWGVDKGYGGFKLNLGDTEWGAWTPTPQ